jgi:predicted phage baseplate assembly protein
MRASETCHDERRRADIRRHTDADGQPDLNGIDYVEVSDDQRSIQVFFLGKAPAQITPTNVRIDGGRRVTGIKVVRLDLCIQEDTELDDCMTVVVDRPGDFSTYTLRLVNADAAGRPGQQPLDGFDPRYAQIEFSFKANCRSDFDCKLEDTCPPESSQQPEINYLAKDYASFRQLILDRLALVMPNWTERHTPDLGITLVELLAYVGDHLSYYQDAVATEAYLDTARQRISVRRHARLVDYQVGEGCNARGWVCLATDTDLVLKPGTFFLITGYNEDLPAGSQMLDMADLREIPPARYEVFQPLIDDQPLALYTEHKSISFYTWGDRECCLPRGATSATLKDIWAEQASDDTSDLAQQPAAAPESAARSTRLRLSPGDVLIFEEVLGPKTGVPADADMSHRHAVRLTRVEPGVDSLYDQPIVEIEWAQEDALPFALCISAIGRAPECAYLDDISVARGNVILVDHGRPIVAEELPPPPPPRQPDLGCAGEGEPLESLPQAQRYQARLRFGPVTHRAPFPTPAYVSRQQVQYLRALLPRVQARVLELLAQTRGSQTLSADQVQELATIFGTRALVQVGLTPPTTTTRSRRPVSAQEQAAAIERLIASEEKYLAKKARRLGLLIAQAEAGSVLGKTTSDEIADLFGQQYVAGLDAQSPAHFGPAAAALSQSVNEALPEVSIVGRRTTRARALLPIVQNGTPLTDSQYAELRRIHGQPALEAAGLQPASDDVDAQQNATMQAEALGRLIANEESPDVAAQLTWTPRLDLLRSGSRDRHVVAEIDDDGRANIRFGNGTSGLLPEPELALFATYRIGRGTAGNVGPDTISRIVFSNARPDGANLRPRNPLATVGGRDAQPLAEAKLFAPTAFRKQIERAVTADDYARLAERDPRVQRAAATLRWNGSWYSVEVAIDPAANQEADQALLDAIRQFLAPYRRIGHDLSVEPARYVPLDIAVTVCVLPSYMRGHVKAAVLDVLSNRGLAGGGHGFFHPDNLTFGGGIALSKLIGAIQAVPGVETVKVDHLRRLYEEDNGELEQSFLPIGQLEIARLDNDRNQPDNGQLHLTLRGGR